MNDKKGIIIAGGLIGIISVLLVLIISIILLFTNLNGVHSVVLDENYKEIHILEGDTLWSIALENMSKEYDTRYLVYKLREFNDLESANIYPGDTIRVPIMNQ